MTRNHGKMIENTADSLLLSKHSIQFSALFLLLSGQIVYFLLTNPSNLFVKGVIQQLRGPNFNQFRPPNPLEWTSDNVDFLLILPHLPT